MSLGVKALQRQLLDAEPNAQRSSPAATDVALESNTDLIALARGSTVTVDSALDSASAPAPAPASASASASASAIVHERFDIGRLSTGLVIRRDLPDLATLGRADVVAAVPTAIDATSEPTLKAGSATQRSKAATLRVRRTDRGVNVVVDASAPTAIVTESAEAVYLNETRDTIEAPPLARDWLTAELTAKTAAPSYRPTEPTAPIARPIARPARIDVRDGATIRMTAVEAEGRARTAFEADLADDAVRLRAAGRADKIAVQRGFLPLRLRAWTTRTTAALSRTTRSQRIALTSAVIAVASIGIATAAIVWACDRVAAAQTRHEATTPSITAPDSPNTPTPK